MKPQVVLAIMFAMVALSRVTAIAQPQAPPEATGAAALQETLTTVIAAAEPSVVAISRAAPQKQPLVEERLGDVFGPLRQATAEESSATVVAAGVIIDPAGLVLTEYRAVREGDEHFVATTNHKKYTAKIRAADPRSGLAVLAIETASSPRRTGTENATPGSFPSIRISNAATLRKGEFVVAIGNPFAIESDAQPTVSWGIITNLARKAPGGANLNDTPGPYNDYRTTINHLGTLIQTDAKLGWSAGGGALVNLRGELVGLTTTLATIAGHEQPAGYAIPTVGSFRRIIDTLKQGREVEYGMLGIGFGPSPLVPNQNQRAALSVGQVYDGGPAARAGLAPGDVLTRIGDHAVGSIDDVQLAVSELPPAATTTIEYQRDGRTAKTQVTLAKLAVLGNKIAAVQPESWRGLQIDYSTTLDATQLAQAIASGAYDAEGCVLVVNVEPESDAWRDGVRPGMFISHVGDKRVTTPEEFQAATKSIGDKLDIKLTQPVAK